MTRIGLQDARSAAAVQAVEPSHDLLLDRKLVQGVSWSAGIKGLTQLLSWASTILVARLLSPEDFGLVAMATLYLGLTALVTEFGLGTAIVALRDLSEELLAQLHAVALLVGFTAFVFSCAVAYPLSRFFDAPELASVVVVLSCSLVLDSLRTVPTALLARGLQFKYLAVLEALRALVAVAVTVSLAAFGAKYWSLVFGNVLAALITTLLLLRLRWQRFARPRVRTLKSTVTFSSQLLLGQLAWYGYANADFLIAGRVLGKIALGEYTLAWTMSSTPAEKITAIFARVIPSMFGAVKHEPKALRRYFLLFTEGLAILTIPASVGLALVAPEFVLLAFGQKWSAAILPLRLLCCYVPIHVLSMLIAPALHVKGQATYLMRMGFCWLAVLPPAFYVSGVRWGTVGIAAVWIVVYPLILLPVYARAFKALGIRMTEYLLSLRATLGSTAIMAVVVLTVRALLPANWPLALQFGIQVAFGAVTYAAAALLFHRTGVLAEFLRATRAGYDAAARRPEA
jgi:O-antigen/teichoic acid export membrane protein